MQSNDSRSSASSHRVGHHVFLASSLQRQPMRQLPRHERQRHHPQDGRRAQRSQPNNDGKNEPVKRSQQYLPPPVPLVVLLGTSIGGVDGGTNVRSGERRDERGCVCCVQGFTIQHPAPIHPDHFESELYGSFGACDRESNSTCIRVV